MVNTENVSVFHKDIPPYKVRIHSERDINVDAKDAAMTYLFNIVRETTTIKHR